MNRKLRVALVGLGYRGSYLFKLLHAMSPLVELVGVADPSELAEEALQRVPLFREGERSHERLILEAKPDLVLIASPWQYHVAQASFALEHGCHVALEIKSGLAPYGAESEYNKLIGLAKERGLKVYPLENALFKREVLAMLCLIEAGALGELVHLRGGYRHDLRHVLLDEAGLPRAEGEGAWRYPYYRSADADIYPTHGIAPLAFFLGLGQRDELASLYSQASKARGLAMRLAKSELEQDKPLLADVITTHIKTKQGVLITLTHDTTLPRPRSLDWEVQGTQGIWDGVARRIYIEGQSPRESWEDDTNYLARYEHPYWSAWGEEALHHDEHHQGMDYIMLRAVLDDLLGASHYPADLSDLALWCSLTALSAESIRRGEALHF